ncbi:MAG: aldehyde dehydrogenase family protein [Acidobacteria bacterium]|nr:aldehyde dehydrogenase family protein [Acidobacteriota bacterium]
MVPSYKNFIAGQWVDAVSHARFENRNPADTRDLVGFFADSSAEDVGRAVRAAAQAFPAWRACPAPLRGEFLYRTGEILKQRKEQIARDMTREMGKILLEARGDVQEAIDMAFWMAGEGRRLYGKTTPSELPNKFNMSVRMPVGVCGIITPWNFPMAIPSWKIFPALICGDTCVLKPATDTPLSAINFIKALEDAGVPPGVVNLITGKGADVGAALVDHDQVQIVSFTGSTATGREVATKCAPSFKKHNLEMGGKNVIMILDDAELNLAVDGAVWGAFGTSGQRCTASSRMVVHKKVYREFLKEFARRARNLSVGNGMKPRTEMGPIINQKQKDSILNWIDIGKKEGATIYLGGRPLEKGNYRHGFFIEPTIFSDVHPQMQIAQEEIFGPVANVLSCSSLEEAIEIANGVRYGLSASIYTRDVNRAFVAVREMYTGIFYVNSPTIGAEIHLPFGGTKNTGNGHREAAEATLDVFSEWKAIYIDYSGRLQRAQIDVGE